MGETQIQTQLTWLGVAALIIGGIVRVLKSDGTAVVLATLYLPPIPKRALPWLALVFGGGAAVLDAKVGGSSWEQAAIVGVGSTALAVLGHDLGKAVPGVNKTLGVLLVVGGLGTLSACTPQGLALAKDILADKIRCGLANQDLPNDMIVKRCALDPEDIPKVIEAVGESRKAGAAHAALAAARASHDAHEEKCAGSAGAR